MDERGAKIRQMRHVETLGATLGLLIILTGPTAAGKTEIRERMTRAEYGKFKPLVTTTSRKRRESERQGLDYHFVTPIAFIEQLDTGVFVEHKEYGGNLYGTTREELERILNGEALISTMEISGAATFPIHVRRVYDADTAERILSKTIVIFVDPESIEAQRERYKKREKGLGSFEVRTVQDRDMMESYGDSFPHRIINRDGEINQAIKRIEDLVKEQFPDLPKDLIS